MLSHICLKQQAYLPRSACPRRVPLIPKAYLSSDSSKLQCPYRVLGLESGADESEIKHAYRRMAKKLHPDVNKDSDAEVQFMAVGDAYDFLINVARGKHVPSSAPSGNSTAFHDWYWSFRMSRTWDKQFRRRSDSTEGRAAASPQSQDGLRGQLAGLRHRAAIRKQRTRTQSKNDSFCRKQGSGDHRDNISAQSHASASQRQQRGFEQSEGAIPYGPEVWCTDVQHELCPCADGPSDSGEPVDPEQAPYQHGGSSRRKFVADSRLYESLRGQLTGMQRIAGMKRQMQNQL